MALFAEFLGGTPKVPSFVPVNAQEVQRKTVAGNTAVLPETIKQTQTLNAANFDAITKMLDQASGGWYQKLQQKYLANIDRQITGNVDLRENLAGTAAANLYRGVGGSQFGALTGIKNAQSYIDQQKALGAGALERWTAATSQIYQPVNAAAMFQRNTLDVGTGLAHATAERNAAFQREYVQNQWDWYGSFGQQLVRFEDTVVQLAGDVAGAAMMACWVAREVMGTHNHRWMLFRHWLFTRAPKWFRNIYIAHGEQFAAWISNKPILKSIIRAWMESRIKTLEVSA